MFAELRDVVSLRVEAPRPVDISPECANMLERLCLAQAQELTFEKFRADGKNPGILARWAPRSWLHPCTHAKCLATGKLQGSADRLWCSGQGACRLPSRQPWTASAQRCPSQAPGKAMKPSAQRRCDPWIACASASLAMTAQEAAPCTCMPQQLSCAAG